jgi:Na+/pantothenate symporter
MHTIRGVTLAFTIVVTIYAMKSRISTFKMVESAYQITQNTAFVPLVAGLFWKCSTTQGALGQFFAVCRYSIPF